MSTTAASRAPMLPWGRVAALLLFGGWLNMQAGSAILTWRADGPAGLLESASPGPLELLALWLALGALWRGGALGQAGGGGLAGPAAWVFAAGMLLPSTLLAALLLVGFGGILAWESRGAARLGALSMAALGANLLWLRYGQPAFGGPLIDAEAWTTHALLSLAEPGLMRLGHQLRMPGGHGIVILPGCSLGQTLPLAILCFLLMHQGASTARRTVVALAGLVLVLAAINLLRLGLLAWSPASFAWGHGLVGANLFGLAAAGAIQLAADAASDHA